MTCQLKRDDFYDLKLLQEAKLPIDALIQKQASKNAYDLSQLRTESRIWKKMYDVTPELVDAFGNEGLNHLKAIREKKGTYDYLYFVAENSDQWYNAPHFEYQQFPLLKRRECVLSRVKKLAHKVAKENTNEFDATCLYLLYFYALLVNPSLNWITIDYLANGNRYHQFGTRLKGKMKTVIKKVWV